MLRSLSQLYHYTTDSRAIAPPIGAPAANVANAMVRAREGGKACARIPSCQIDERKSSV